MRFNINEKIRVKLTDKGRAIMRDQHQAYVDAFPGVFGKFIPKSEDDSGWSEWQMWDLMNTFGQHLRMGLPVPFETEIEIPVPANAAAG